MMSQQFIFFIFLWSIISKDVYGEFGSTQGVHRELSFLVHLNCNHPPPWVVLKELKHLQWARQMHIPMAYVAIYFSIKFA